MKKIFLILALILIPLCAQAADYTITKYQIEIVVSPDNIFNVTEKIDVNFLIPRHGIFRKIPMQNEVIRQDGTTSRNRAKIKDISVDDRVSVYGENGYKIIKIGHPDITLTGPKSYTIKYSYNIGNDKGKGYDEFYYNIIGNEWDTTISDISFHVKMPKPFDKGKLGTTYGPKGSTKVAKNTVISGNDIYGRFRGTLYPGEGMTVRLELPEGYFEKQKFNIDLMTLLALVLPVIFAITSFVLWAKHGKDDPVYATVEFYPPKGFNSAEVGFLYRGEAQTKDVISLLVYLASKGYLRIEGYEQEALFATTGSFMITKLKDYDGDNPNEKSFFRGLFKRKSVVTELDLRDRFYETLDKIKKDLNQGSNKYRIFTRESLVKYTPIPIAMAIISYCLITAKPVIENIGSEAVLFALLFPIIGFSVLFFMGIMGGNNFARIFGVIWGLSFGAIPWFTLVLPAVLADEMYAIVYAIGVVCIVIMAIFAKLMSKRTFYGTRMLGKVKGFKNFLETAEKPKLEALVEQDPEYFYSILPYAYVLDVSDKWIKKFETIAIEPRDYYGTNGTFISTSTFSSIMSSASSSMASSPSSDGGGGGFSGGGGGCSGGGSGGGGGGSW